jgi:tripartite-type tricarboxylate transporter receptor subunit TctC
MSTRVVRKLFALPLALVMASGALAQPYPSRPITMIVPFAPGGPTDTIARILAEPMRGLLGQPVVIENVSGGGGNIGVGRVARATPDGYTLCVGNLSSHVMNGAVYTLPYDLMADFAPVALLSFQPMLMVARKTMPANNLRELIAWLKANSGKASLGIQGVGTAGHVFAVFFSKQTGTSVQLVPYRGAGPAMQDLVAGQIDFMIDTPTNSLPQVQAGTIKAYAVTAANRLASAPEIPTVDEAGLPGFHFSFWQALWAPKGTPVAVIDKLNAAVVASLAAATVRQRFAEQGQDTPPPAQQTPKALADYHKAEIEKWWPVVKAANIKAE